MCLCIYGDYIRELDARNAGRDKDQMTFIDRNLCPTLTDFYNELRGQYTPETKYIAMALERYTIGSLDSFAKKTNTQTGGRFVVYDTKDLGIGMADMAAQICLGDIWNRLIETARENRRTWIYFNKFYGCTCCGILFRSSWLGFAEGYHKRYDGNDI